MMKGVGDLCNPLPPELIEAGMGIGTKPYPCNKFPDERVLNLPYKPAANPRRRMYLSSFIFIHLSAHGNQG